MAYTPPASSSIAFSLKAYTAPSPGSVAFELAAGAPGGIVGTMAVTETGADVFASSGNVVVKGSLVVT